MRRLVVASSVLISLFSIALDLLGPDWNSSICRVGLCRFDQLYSSIEATGVTTDNLKVLINLDPQNPMIWCTYGEVLSGQNNVSAAGAAFDRAIRLGPEMSPVLMRATNFAFAHGQTERGFRVSGRILSQTSVFDEIIFSYLRRSGASMSQLLGTAVPLDERAARAWLEWLRTDGSDQDLKETWIWTKNKHLLNQQVAIDVVSSLWERRSFHLARELWVGWEVANGKMMAQSSLVANGQFKDEPAGGPFDWTLSPSSAARISRHNGLEVRFSGTENIAFSNVRQDVVVDAGRYRFSAEIEAIDITTDETPFFTLFDPVNPGAFRVQTAPVGGSLPRSRLTLDFSVPHITQALVIELDRRPSRNFDNKIGGTLRIYEISLEDLANR